MFSSAMASGGDKGDTGQEKYSEATDANNPNNFRGKDIEIEYE